MQVTILICFCKRMRFFSRYLNKNQVMCTLIEYALILMNEHYMLVEVFHSFLCCIKNNCLWENIPKTISATNVVLKWRLKLFYYELRLTF